MLAVVFTKSLTRRSYSKRFVDHVLILLRLDGLSITSQLVLLKLLHRCKDVHVEVPAVEGRLAPTVFASCNVESELAIVV